MAPVAARGEPSRGEWIPAAAGRRDGPAHGGLSGVCESVLRGVRAAVSGAARRYGVIARSPGHSRVKTLTELCLVVCIVAVMTLVSRQLQQPTPVVVWDAGQYYSMARAF